MISSSSSRSSSVSEGDPSSPGRRRVPGLAHASRSPLSPEPCPVRAFVSPVWLCSRTVTGIITLAVEQEITGSARNLYLDAYYMFSLMVL